MTCHMYWDRLSTCAIGKRESARQKKSSTFMFGMMRFRWVRRCSKRKSRYSNRIISSFARSFVRVCFACVVVCCCGRSAPINSIIPGSIQAPTVFLAAGGTIMLTVKISLKIYSYSNTVPESDGIISAAGISGQGREGGGHACYLLFGAG